MKTRETDLVPLLPPYLITPSPRLAGSSEISVCETEKNMELIYKLQHFQTGVLHRPGASCTLFGGRNRAASVCAPTHACGGCKAGCDKCIENHRGHRSWKISKQHSHREVSAFYKMLCYINHVTRRLHLVECLPSLHNVLASSSTTAILDIVVLTISAH